MKGFVRVLCYRGSISEAISWSDLFDEIVREIDFERQTQGGTASMVPIESEFYSISQTGKQYDPYCTVNTFKKKTAAKVNPLGISRFWITGSCIPIERDTVCYPIPANDIEKLSR